jgi:hypothetical protein
LPEYTYEMYVRDVEYGGDGIPLFLSDRDVYRGEQFRWNEPVGSAKVVRDRPG